MDEGAARAVGGFGVAERGGNTAVVGRIAAATGKMSAAVG